LVRVGIDATCWANQRGYGRFTREVVTAMVREAPDVRFVCFLDNKSAASFELRTDNVTTIVVPLSAAPSDAAAASGNRSVTDILRMTRAVSKESLDVFFSPSIYTYFPLLPPLSRRCVVTIHDAIAERFPALTLPSRRARLFWRIKAWAAVRQARRILTVSRYAAAEVSRAHHVPLEKISIATEAPAPAYHPRHEPALIRQAASAVGLPKGARWFTYVGGFNPHKNIPALVRAHASLVREREDAAPYLLLIGTLDADVFYNDQSAIRAAIDAAGTAAMVVWAGYLDDDRVALLHSGAIALVLPSASEGFGLPAVEAAACDTPVIATTESPLPELLEGGGLFVPPGDELALAAAMKRLADDADLRSRLGREGGRRARLLSWNDAAAACLLALREVAAQ
jgi:glycosyltransferase involved in cell wall biosynthesis